MVSVHYLIAQGEILEITETHKQQIHDQVPVFATDSLRTMLIAIAGTQNQLRPEVIQAVKNCRTSTGDLIATVRVITTRKGSTHHVVACSFPMDKLRLVSFFMECGEVVAVTSNGSNNSLALK